MADRVSSNFIKTFRSTTLHQLMRKKEDDIKRLAQRNINEKVREEKREL